MTKPRSTLELLTKSQIQKSLFPSNIAFTAEEAERFLDYVIEESALLKNARVVKMDQQEKNIRGVGLAAGTNILKPAIQFTGGTTMLLEAELAFSKVTLSTKKARGCVPVYDDDLEDNIEGDAFADHLLRMIAAKVANELEHAFLMSAPTTDLASATECLDLEDVWKGFYYFLRNETFVEETCKRLTKAAYPYIAAYNATTYLWDFKFGEMLRWLPNKYKIKPNDLRFFVAPAIGEDYVNVLASRGTILGDKAIISGLPMSYKGIPIVEIPLLPTTTPILGATTPGDTVVDVTSAAGQKVLSVAAPTANFAQDDIVRIGSWDNTLFPDMAYKVENGVVDTVQADVSLTLKENLKYAHVGADAEPVQEVTADGSFAILTHWANFIIGLQRVLKLETSRDAANERTLFYFSLRADLAVEQPGAAVLYDDLKQR